MGLVFIFLIPVLERFYLNEQGEKFKRQDLYRIGPYLVLTVGYIILHISVSGRLSGIRLQFDLANVYLNLITFFKGFCLYLYKLLFPVTLSAYLQVEMITKCFPLFHLFLHAKDRI
jgi:hypothetical protein